MIKRLGINSVFVLVIGFGVFAGMAQAEDSLAQKICRSHYTFEEDEDGVEQFERRILGYLNLPYDVSNREIVISDFFNKNSSTLICGNDSALKKQGLRACIQTFNCPQRFLFLGTCGI